MQGLLPAVVGPSPLSLANLSAHTKQEGLAPRRTVRLYLEDQRRTAGQYDLRPPPSDEFDALDPASFPVVEVARSAEGGGKKQRVVDEGSRRDTALVMHVPNVNGVTGRAQASAGREMTRSRSKPSLVAAMRPRLSSAPNSSSPAPPTKRKDTVKLAVAEEVNAAAGPSGSSSVLVARVEQKSPAARPRSPAQGVEQPEEVEQMKEDRKGKGKAKEEEPVKSSKSAIVKKGKLRAEVEDDEEEKEEVEDRLRARRERRASKALIRKDRTQTAASVGVAAAEKVKKAAKAKKRAARGLEDGSDTASSSPKKVKKKRTSMEKESRAKMQDLERPSGVGAARLTLKPPKQLGIFNKGKASARTKAGQPLPDLAFSELNFLNSTCRSPPPSPSGSSPSSDENLPPPPSLLRPTTLPRTYGSKSKTRRTSSKHFPADAREEIEAVEALPSPKKKKLKPVAGDGRQAKEKQALPEQRTKPRTVFSHVEIPVYRSSSSASLSRSPPRSPPKRKTRPSTAVTGTTNDSVLSAASLARRRRSAPAAPAKRIELDDLPEPTLRRRPPVVEQEQAEASAPSFGGGFDAHPVEQLPSSAIDQEPSLRSSDIQRMIDDAGASSASLAQPASEAGQPPLGTAFSPLRGDDTFVGPSSLAETPSFVAEDRFIHLRHPPPAAAALSSGGGNEIPSFADAPPLPSAGPDAVFARPDTQSLYGAGAGEDATMAGAEEDDEAFHRAAFPPPFHADAISAFASVLPSCGATSTSSAPSALGPLAGAEEETGRPTFLRSTVPPALPGMRGADYVLEDETEWREAMRRQWPRTRC